MSEDMWRRRFFLMLLLGSSTRAFLPQRHCRKICGNDSVQNRIETTVREFSTRIYSNEKEREEGRVHTVTWNTADGPVEFKAMDGELLRTSALRRGVVSPHNGRSRLINCRGLGTCGTCAVELDGGMVDPVERNQVEQLRLSFPPHSLQSPNLRLACQVQIRGDIMVTKRTGFWGQYDELAKKSESETYFGELEYVLDRRSPNNSNEKQK